MQGKIIKGIAGFYYVHVEGQGTYECRAKGIFRKDGVKPLVGQKNITGISLICGNPRGKCGKKAKNFIRFFEK